MSFGFSISDFITVGNLAWQVYKSCKDAPESFKNISQEVLSLHAVLKEVEETFLGHPLPQSKEAALAMIAGGCQDVLQDLQSLILKYESLGSNTKRTWDRMRWHVDDITELRARLTSNTVLLTTFISASQVVVNRQLNKFMQEFKDGKHEPSVITTQTMESLSVDEKQTWRTIRKELEGIGISVAAIDSNKGFILDWFKEAISSGAFEEQALEEGSSSILCHDDPRQSVEDSYITVCGHVTQEVPQRRSKDVEFTDPNQVGARSPTKMPQNYVAPASRLPSKGHVQGTPQTPPNMFAQRKRLPQVATLVSWAFRYEKALHRAVKDGNEATVRKLLFVKGVDVDCRDGNLTPLYFAALMRHGPILTLLLHVGADPNPMDSFGCTALFYAARHGEEIMVRQLLEKGANIDVVTRDNETPLFEAASHGNKDTVRLLLEYGADIDLEDKSGHTPTSIAMSKGSVTIVSLLLENGGSTHSRAMSEESLFLLATKYGSEAIVRLLLEKGANIDSKDRSDMTPLHMASREGQETILKLLLKNGADINSRDESSQTPLIRAADNGYEAIVKLLLEEGADINSKDRNDCTALFMAVRKKHEDIVSLLLEKGANINSKDHMSWTPLFLAVLVGGEAIVRLLLEKGANPDWEVLSGETPRTVNLRRGNTFFVASKQLTLLCYKGFPTMGYKT